MFRALRGEGGGFTPLAAALALLALSVLVPSRALGRLCLAAAAATLLAAGVRRLVARARPEPLDVGRLVRAADRFRREAAEEEDGSEEADPYCSSCDEARPPGTRRCPACGRALV